MVPYFKSMFLSESIIVQLGPPHHPKQQYVPSKQPTLLPPPQPRLPQTSPEASMVTKVSGSPRQSLRVKLRTSEGSYLAINYSCLVQPRDCALEE